MLGVSARGVLQTINAIIVDDLSPSCLFIETNNKKSWTNGDLKEPVIRKWLTIVVISVGLPHYVLIAGQPFTIAILNERAKTLTFFFNWLLKFNFFILFLDSIYHLKLFLEKMSFRIYIYFFFSLFKFEN